MAEKLSEELCLNVTFASLTIRKLFMTCMEFKKCMIIRSMEDNGHFHGEVAIM